MLAYLKKIWVRDFDHSMLTFSKNVNNTALKNVDVMTYILHPFAMHNVVKTVCE